MIGWWRRRRRAKLLSQAQDSGVLREFIYLDGVSVYSLLASRRGPVAQEVKDTHSRGSEAETSGKIGGDLLALNAESSVRASFSRSSGSEILRKSIIQASFKDLVDLEKDRLILASASAKDAPTAAPVANAEFARGRLLEVDVELDVEPIYRMNAVLSSMMGIASASPDLFGTQTATQLRQGQAIEVALQGLLGGLVPVRARIPDYASLVVGDVESVVPRKNLSVKERARARPLYLVGVAEESLFWKDVRRVLFSGSRYTVLARVAASGVQNSWNPVKLSHVLESFAPDLGAQINQMSTLALQSVKKPAVEAESSKKIGELLPTFIRLLAERSSLPVPQVANVGQSIVERHETAPYTIEGWRSACDEVVEAVFAVPSASRPAADEIARIRQKAQAAATGLDAHTAPVDAEDVGGAPCFLDCELVAIYW